MRVPSYPPHPTVFSLDYDNTVSRDVLTWLATIKLWRQAGHTVYLVTMRYSEESLLGDESVAQEIVDAVNAVFFTARQAKRPFLANLGIRVDVWIDDTPEALFLNAQDIWPEVTPKGTVVMAENPATHPKSVMIDLTNLVAHVYRYIVLIEEGVGQSLEEVQLEVQNQATLDPDSKTEQEMLSLLLDMKNALVAPR